LRSLLSDGILGESKDHIRDNYLEDIPDQVVHHAWILYKKAVYKLQTYTDYIQRRRKPCSIFQVDGNLRQKISCPLSANTVLRIRNQEIPSRQTENKNRNKNCKKKNWAGQSKADTVTVVRVGTVSCCKGTSAHRQDTQEP
jgi:hypothetical protein